MAKWKPKKSDYQEAVRSQSPWHHDGVVPVEWAPPTYRPLATVLWQQLYLDRKVRRHQIILGPRRVGKTTVMYQTVRELLKQNVSPDKLWWIRLDHPLLLDWELGNLVKQICQLSRASEADPVYVFLDELTYAENWDLWLKAFHDERWPVRIVGTSSATAAIKQRGMESGVGRWDEQFLAPYLFTEYLDLQEYPSAIQCAATLGETITRAIQSKINVGVLAEQRRRFLLTGGFPELLLSGRRADEESELLRSQRILRSDAIEKALYKDLPQAFSIQDPAKLERLLYVLAGQLTGVLSPNTVAADLGTAPATIERYISFLERAFLVFTLPNYSTSEETVQRRGKRLYFVDGAVRNAALLRGAAPMSDAAEMGVLVENMAASHLRVLAYQEGIRVYHWRHKNIEVDLVYDHPDDPLAFEVTVSSDHKYGGLLAFQERFPKFRGCCYLVSDNPEIRLPTFDLPGRIPLDMFFVMVGEQEESSLKKRVGGFIRNPDGQLLLF